MKGGTRYSVIKPLLAHLPHGAPFSLATLKSLGVSTKLAAQYVKSGWLVRLGQGIYAFPGDPLDLERCLLLLQEIVPSLHIGGKRALALHGVRHFVEPAPEWQLWGASRFALPAWIQKRCRARYVYTSLFKWEGDPSLEALTISSPPGVTEGLRVSVPERSVLEMLSEAGGAQDLEEAWQLFESLRNLRGPIQGRLLACCQSVKTKRLFLSWARKTGIVDADRLISEYKIDVGSPSRWMSRLKDGTLLTLKAHG